MTKALTAALVALIAATGCASSGSTGTAAPALGTSLPRCDHAPYSLKMVDRISPVTGEHAFLVQVLYAGRGDCRVVGYPNVTFLAADGAAIPFRYRDGGGQYLTREAPKVVSLRPGDTFFIAIAKYRCDVRTQRSARYAVVRVPGGRSPLRIDLARENVTSIDYCAEAASRVVYLSPIVGSERQLFLH